MSSLDSNPHLLDKRKTRSGFERAAHTYDEAAVLQREVGNELLERLDWVKLAPNRVLDLGCGTGMVSEALLKRYPKAEVIGVDIAFSMVQQTLKRRHWLRKPLGVCADVQALPFASQSCDLLISNVMLQWCNDLVPVFKECVRVLRPNGLLTFATFGSDTLKELRASWSQVDGYPHVSRFLDMHDIGDALLAAGFRDPVVDREDKVLLYDQVKDLLKDLKAIGANNATQGRAQGLMGKQRLQALYQAYEEFRGVDGQLPATYEVIFGHAWAPTLSPSTLPERYIPIQSI
ncbi:MAG: malonyl-ACP O-methyltransferase BioC [Pseudomonadota bacterium]|jgi:malonyl-CoA O-methyltransferase